MRLQSADTLKALMAQRGYSMSRTARYADCSKSFISHLAEGRKSTCTPALAQRIAEALDVPLSVLFVASVPVDDGRIVRGKRAVA